MKINTLVFALLSILFCATSCQNKVTERISKQGALQFETVAKEYHGGYGQRNDLVIKDDVAWKDLWNKTYSHIIPMPNLPQVDFRKEMIIAVYMGARNSGGFSIDIASIQDLGSSIEVSVKEIVPFSGQGIVTMALTQPYHIVKVPKQDKKVVFRRAHSGEFAKLLNAE